MTDGTHIHIPRQIGPIYNVVRGTKVYAPEMYGQGYGYNVEEYHDGEHVTIQDNEGKYYIGVLKWEREVDGDLRSNMIWVAYVL